MTVDVYRIGSRTRVAIGLGGCEHVVSPEDAYALAVKIVVALNRDTVTAADAEVASWDDNHVVSLT
jgi:hypothetical protein